MSTGNVHLIVTCTRRKTVAAGDAVFPDERDLERAYGIWLERLAQARRGSPPMSAGELYTGQHWSRAAAAAARKGAEMWVISAGLGLLHVSDPVVPYEATFSSMPFCHRTHWERLTTRPPSEPEVATIDSGANTAALAKLNADKPDGETMTIRQNKYLNNMVEQGHRNIKRRIRPMLGFKSFCRAQTILAGIELIHMIRKGQYQHPAGDGMSPAEQFYLLAA